MDNMLALGKPPFICIPITGRTNEEVIEQLKKIIPLRPDIIEWRADFFRQINEKEEVIKVLKKIKGKTDIPILFTIRSLEEGGEKSALKSREEIFEVLKIVCLTSMVHFIDVEINNDEQAIKSLLKEAEKHHIKTILSYHHFTKTPAKNKLIQLGERAVHLGGDIVKIAVMPNAKSDVLDLLHVTNELNERLPISIVTMSMGKLGEMSRIIGWAYGSLITFVAGTKPSAPGQLPIKELRETISTLRKLIKE